MNFNSKYPSVGHLRKRAKRRLPPFAFEYLDGGCNEDINVTDNLVSIGKLQGIPVIDHIIIGNNNYFSFYENNSLER